VVVTVLAVIVVLTLLKPESNSPLSGISGGTETTPTIAQGPSGGTQGGPNQGGGPNGGGNGHNNGQGGQNGSGNEATPGGSETAAGSASGSPTFPSPPPAAAPIAPGEGTDGDSPTVDQYADTLGRLDAALN
jgi:hypothetical protein